MSFKVGDKVRVFQDTKSNISKLFGVGEIVSNSHVDECGRLRVRYITLDDRDFIEHDFKLWVHPNDMRLLTPLEQLL